MDRRFFAAKLQSMRDTIPLAKLAIIEDCSHILHVEQPQAVTMLL
jgi:pimeloyl-ACP methyl ester carboxylesterase